jgi:gentisate 1,2-dioxygenase
MATNTSPASERDRYYSHLSQLGLTPLWTVMSETIPHEPTPACAPAFWNYASDIRPHLMEAGDLISAEEAQRRVLMLNNGSLPKGTTHTLLCAIQLIKGGETAPAHRHTQSALRFVIEGEGAYTAVDGERTYMRPGDFVVTPAWTWHDHGKDTDGPMVWLDGLDIPLVNHLGATFSEDHPQSRHPASRAPGDSSARYGAGLLPLHTPATSAHSPLFSYPYERTRAALEALARGGGPVDDVDGIKMKYANPLNGDFVLPTIATFIQWLPRGFRGLRHRSTASTVFIVVEGRGTVRIGEREHAFGPHDIFVVPNWTWAAFDSGRDDVVLFSYSDRAVLEKLGLWREQVARG